MFDGLETAVELRDAIRGGELTAREAVERALGRVEDRADLGAFITVTAETALAEADAADLRFRAVAGGTSGALPALHGLPLAHKDLVDVRGAPTTHGSAAVPHAVAAEDHPGVAVLRRAGAISLGKTQVPEFGLNAYSENLIADPARNPWDPERTPGGSSGGAAAAVAAGLLPVAPGSDGGGSIRIPALACGLIGLKPGLGTVPTDLVQGKVDDFGAPRLIVSGPLARTAEDAALLFDAMGGTGRALEAVRRADAIRGLRVGADTRSPFDSAFDVSLSPESRRAYEIAVERLEALGHPVEQAGFAYDPDYAEMFTISWTAGLSLLEIDPAREHRLAELTRTVRDRALARPRETHLAAAAWLHRFAADVRAQWGRYDVVLTPGLAMLPPRIGEFMALAPDADYRLQCEWTPYTSMVNVSGLPAVAVPILGPGSAAEQGGLPMGVQLIGRPGGEAQLLQLAAQLTR